MAILIGIDEAGYGPVMGPLVVSSTAFMLPDELLRVDLWQILSRSIGRDKRSLKGRLLIADSKKAFNRSSGGLGHLQRSVLCVLKSMGCEPANLKEMISMLSAETLCNINRYPWYKHLDNVGIDSANAEYSIAAGVFAADCKKNGISVAEMKAEVFDVLRYNDMIEKVQNKSLVLFTAVCRHIDRAFRNFGTQNLQIVVDRQGGRSRYMPVLMRMFPQASGRIILESDKICSYELTQGERKMKIHFAVEADNKYAAVSLASNVSKYLRELLMERINEFFRDKNPKIAPTAGYWTDGNRFLNDIEPIIDELKLDKKMLIRLK